MKRRIALSSTAKRLSCVVIVVVLVAATAYAGDSIDDLVVQTTRAEASLSSAKSRHASSEDIARANSEIAKRRRALDEARAESLAEFAGVDAAEITQQLQAGRTWRDIAQQFGVHPSVIGIRLIDEKPPSFSLPNPN